MSFCALMQRLSYLLALFCIPLYFASRAKEVLEAYSHGEPRTDDITLSRSSGRFQDEENISPPSLVYTPLPSPRPRVNDGSSMVSTLQTLPPIRRHRNVDLEQSWTTCVDHWRRLWRIAASVAFTILVASSALLQMPGTNGDPLTRCFVYLFILRLVPALVSAAMLLYFFSKSYIRSGNFAIIWCQYAEAHYQSSLYMPWTLLALPIIAISWGSIFMLVAVFLSLWGDGLYPNLPSVEEVYPLTIMALRIIITTLSVVDVGWVWWLVIRLRAFDQAAKIIPGTV